MQRFAPPALCTAGARQAAHEPPVAKPTRSRAPAAGTRASVTAVLFLRGGSVLATGGTGDACVKLWDARNLAEPMVRAQLLAHPEGHTDGACAHAC